MSSSNSSSSAKKVGEWTWEENKAFEVALDRVPEGTPNRWAVIAASFVPGKSSEEIAEHYEKLVYDVALIEAGYFDDDDQSVPSSAAQKSISAAKDGTTTIAGKEGGSGGGRGGEGSGGKKKINKKKN